VQERDDYADPGPSPAWQPPVGLVVVMIFLLISGGLFLITFCAAGILPIR
jgi:hypothetical protein